MGVNLEQLAYKAKELEDRVTILREDEAELKENEETTIKAYEDIKDKIAQI